MPGIYNEVDKEEASKRDGHWIFVCRWYMLVFMVLD